MEQSNLKAWHPYKCCKCMAMSCNQFSRIVISAYSSLRSTPATSRASKRGCSVSKCSINSEFIRRITSISHNWRPRSFLPSGYIFFPGAANHQQPPSNARLMVAPAEFTLSGYDEAMVLPLLPRNMCGSHPNLLSSINCR